ncbi:MAG: hypothetical protein H6730_14975 [Deltaproteobacteria bacterium]|nr:hypothetical protein [Deltaproteobacteria bacterium]
MACGPRGGGGAARFTEVEMGADVFSWGISAGMTEEARATVERCQDPLQGPDGDPQGQGGEEINVTARKLWSTYANKGFSHL